VPGKIASLEAAALEPQRLASSPEDPAGLEPREWDWEDLYTRLGPGLIRLAAYRFGLRREDAEEALQAAATAIVLAASSVRSPEAYLTSVFLRECLGHLRRRGQIERNEIPAPAQFDPADDSCDRIEVVCRFRRAFALLSPVCRKMMRSCLLGGKRRIDASPTAALPERTAYSRYRKCLRTLADGLG